MIIDTHAHIYPNKIAQRAVDSIRDFYDIEMDSDGTVETLIKLGDEAQVSRFVIHSVATTPNQVERINDFIIESKDRYPDRLIGFATMQQDYENIPNEIDRIIAKGLQGIKLHPDFQKFNIDDKKAYAIYECAEGRLPILFHMGDDRYDYSSPKRLATILKRFPKLTVIGAHFAGYSVWDEAARVLGDTGIYVDTSSSFFKISPEKGRELVNIYGADKVLFASDYPMWTPKDELVNIDKMELDATTKEKILYKNAVKLFGL